MLPLRFSALISCFSPFLLMIFIDYFARRLRLMNAADYCCRPFSLRHAAIFFRFLAFRFFAMAPPCCCFSLAPRCHGFSLLRFRQLVFFAAAADFADIFAMMMPPPLFLLPAEDFAFSIYFQLSYCRHCFILFLSLFTIFAALMIRFFSPFRLLIFLSCWL